MTGYILTFAAGAAIGWVAAWFVVQRKLIGPLERQIDDAEAVMQEREHFLTNDMRGRTIKGNPFQ